jgi:hypothetical protein
MNTEMTPEQREAAARLLETQAETNDAYMVRMAETSARTNGRLGDLNNPSMYNAHAKAAAAKRLQAANIRATGKPGKWAEVPPCDDPRM